jgi:YD repeat-containing protein
MSNYFSVAPPVANTPAPATPSSVERPLQGGRAYGGWHDLIRLQTDNTNHTWASGVVYNPASQMTNATFPSGTETWGYNTLSQLTQRTTTSGSTTRMNIDLQLHRGKGTTARLAAARTL